MRGQWEETFFLPWVEKTQRNRWTKRWGGELPINHVGPNTVLQVRVLVTRVSNFKIAVTRHCMRGSQIDSQGLITMGFLEREPLLTGYNF